MSASTMDDALDEVVGQLPRRKMSGKKLVLLVLLPLLMLAGVGGALVVTGALDPLLNPDPAVVEAEPEAPVAGPGYFYELPDIIVNLNTANRRQNFLKISVSLELADQESVAQLEQVLPRIIDNFQVYLRELRLEDLRGSAGLYRLREEMLRRVNAAAHPVPVRDVLFREMLVQ
ncbi:MAG: flagellar basal body-associated FliL family protein [Inquilinaceae bacterium]